MSIAALSVKLPGTHPKAAFKRECKFLALQWISSPILALGEKLTLSSNNCIPLKNTCLFSLERKNSIRELEGFYTLVII